MAKPAPPADQDELQSILKKVEQVAPYQDMMRYLGMRDAVPPMRMGYIGTYGKFTFPTAELPKGEIVLNPGVGAITATHEITHPVMRQLREQVEASINKGGDDQFVDAYSKILYDPTRRKTGKDSIPILDFVETLAPEWATKNKRYRATIAELPSFALERAAIPEGRQTGEEAPPHVDPTIATQMMILLDLATRAQKAKPQSQGR